MSATDQLPPPSDGKQPAGKLASAVIVAVGGLLGLVCSEVFVPPIMLRGPTAADLVRECVINCIGVVLGALFFSWLNNRWVRW